MTEFDVGRIVPSTRDFAGAVRTRRKGLALVPLIDTDRVEEEVRRLDALDVRALAIDVCGEKSLLAARTTTSTPLLLLPPATSTDMCQRARFFGADCVTLADYAAHRQTVQSMRMMPAADVTSPDEAVAAIAADARVLVVRATLSGVLAVSAATDAKVTLVAHIPDADVATLEALSGHVDAATVPSSVHASDTFEALLDSLD